MANERTAEEIAAAEAEAKVKADAEAAEKAKVDAEIAAKEEKKANLDKAINEAEDELRRKREAKKDLEQPKPANEEIPTIDMNDPGAKAWDKHIKETVAPISQEIEKEKAEIRKFALNEFLQDKPALAKDPAKVKELVEIYDRIKTATERNKEGILLDLKRAFGAIYSEQLINAAQTQRFEEVKQMQIFSDPAIDRGATAYSTETDRLPKMSSDDLAQLAKWGMTPQQWYDMQKPKPQA